MEDDRREDNFPPRSASDVGRADHQPNPTWPANPTYEHDPVPYQVTWDRANISCCDLASLAAVLAGRTQEVLRRDLAQLASHRTREGGRWHEQYRGLCAAGDASADPAAQQSG